MPLLNIVVMLIVVGVGFVLDQPVQFRWHRVSNRSECCRGSGWSASGCCRRRDCGQFLHIPALTVNAAGN